MALVVRFDFFPTRTLPGTKDALGMPVMIEVVMLTVFECFVTVRS